MRLRSRRLGHPMCVTRQRIENFKMGDTAVHWTTRVHAMSMRWKSVEASQATHVSSNLGPKAMQGKSDVHPTGMQRQANRAGDRESEGGGERERGREHIINQYEGEAMQLSVHVQDAVRAKASVTLNMSLIVVSM